MKKLAIVGIIAIGMTLLPLLSTAGKPPPSFPACNTVDPTDASLVAKGKKLFNSKVAFDQTGPFPACASCHPGANEFTDNESHTVAPTGDLSITFPRQTPSLLQNLSQTAPYLWDGRAPCIQKQAIGAITSPLEMGGVTPTQDQLDAIAAYVLSLKPPEPLTGLDPVKVARGQEIFMSPGGQCARCHSGPNFTDNQFHNIGIGDGDPGANLVGTGGKFAFNTPQLLGIRVSPPYFHNGRNGIPVDSTIRVATTDREALRQVVEFYNDLFKLNLTSDQMDDLVEFLMSL